MSGGQDPRAATAAALQACVEQALRWKKRTG